MKRASMALAILAIASALAWSQGAAMGRLSECPYPRTVALLDGALQVSFDRGEDGGLFVLVRARTDGWVGVGLGAEIMSGAIIFMGYVKDGKAFFSEQLGTGHSHAPIDATWDREEVYQEGGFTSVEFHLPPDKIPSSGDSLPFIAAYSDAADFATYHEDRHDSGVLDLR